MDKEFKTVYRYDTGGGGFRKAALILFGLAGILAVFGIFWIGSWI
ncbi:MAG: hypothetical protein QF743_09205 [Candidatus Marinimicrobia bacterium]|jgi:hypothetical protein|nr:hypothetical protein [Candidatus Neomarinimicrobiota bacterium]|tara:strand:- start:1886 stop:2020 length:135 start_codon:yes stop_codon:yes gene_type:complete